VSVKFLDFTTKISVLFLKVCVKRYFLSSPSTDSNLVLIPCGCEQTFVAVRDMRILPRYVVSTSCTTERLQNTLECVCVLLNFKTNIDIWSSDKETRENKLSHRSCRPRATALLVELECTFALTSIKVVSRL
jgi:hypothetical protein